MTNAVVQAKLWYWQRVSAMVLGVCVLVHLVIIIGAVRGGLTAAEILGRTHGNSALGAFYSVFVFACAVHVPIGLLRVIEEWLGLRGAAVNVLANLFSLVLLVMGLRAVYGVIVA